MLLSDHQAHARVLRRAPPRLSAGPELDHANLGKEHARRQIAPPRATTTRTYERALRRQGIKAAAAVPASASPPSLPRGSESLLPRVRSPERNRARRNKKKLWATGRHAPQQLPPQSPHLLTSPRQFRPSPRPQPPRAVLLPRPTPRTARRRAEAALTERRRH